MRKSIDVREKNRHRGDKMTPENSNIVKIEFRVILLAKVCSKFLRL